eukprot:g31241.t1
MTSACTCCGGCLAGIGLLGATLRYVEQQFGPTEKALPAPPAPAAPAVLFKNQEMSVLDVARQAAKSEISKVAAQEVRDQQADSGSQHKASQPSPTEFYEEAFLPEDEDFEADLDAARHLWDCSDNDDHGGQVHTPLPATAQHDAQLEQAVPEEMKSPDTAPDALEADTAALQDADRQDSLSEREKPETQAFDTHLGLLPSCETLL